MAIGGTAKITVKAPVGPTCTVVVTYPSGGKASLPGPKHPNPGWWVWSWTVPKSANTGNATFKTACTYAGLTKRGNGDFTIVAAAIVGWTVDGHAPTTRSSTSTSQFIITIDVKGTLPVDPETNVATFNCYYLIHFLTIQYQAWVYDLTATDADRQFALSVDVGAVGPAQVGTGTWSIRCQNSLEGHTTEDTDIGTFEVY